MIWQHLAGLSYVVADDGDKGATKQIRILRQNIVVIENIKHLWISSHEVPCQETRSACKHITSSSV